MSSRWHHWNHLLTAVAACIEIGSDARTRMVNEHRIANGSLAEGSVQWCRAIDTPIIACTLQANRNLSEDVRVLCQLILLETFVIYLF